MKKVNLNEIINESRMTELSNNVMEDIDGGCHIMYIIGASSGGTRYNIISSTTTYCANSIGKQTCISTTVSYREYWLL